MDNFHLNEVIQKMLNPIPSDRITLEEAYSLLDFSVIMKDFKTMPKTKAIILGDYCVGKSSVLDRICNQPYDPKVTLGARCLTLAVNQNRKEHPL